ncbi:MAG: helix-turn-helix domain-containing protein [Actinomycetota bacterium]|nr:helix-turn-helix domain-containing protein [Actinomycetota bacterium]
MSEPTLALARFARVTGNALLTLAADLETSSAVPDLAVEEVEIPVGRGQRQQQILEVAGLAAEEGLKTSDVASAISYEVPNTYSTLQALERAGMVELVPGVTPQRWRLAPRYRTTSTVFKRVASRLRPGEWTTYGDISIAVRGDVKAARGVGRAAATMPDFPNAKQVLMEGGLINPRWHDEQGRGPDYCRQQLEQQGITFSPDGRADETRRVPYDELRRRDETEPVAE